MSETTTLHRIDKYDVPESELQQFLDGIVLSHSRIDGIAGCLRNEVLVKCQGEGRFNVVTHVVWKDEKAYGAAVVEMAQFHETRGGRPVLPISIKADRADYVPVVFAKEA